MLNKLRQLFGEKKTANIIGLDIGSGAVKMVEMIWRNGNPVIKSAAIVQLSQGVFTDGYISDTQKVTEILRKLLVAASTNCTRVIAAVGGRIVFIREVVFPAMTMDELREAIKWDIEKYVPFAPGTYFYDFSIVSDGTGHPDMKVLLVAAPQDAINALLISVKQAGLEPAVIDVEPLAIYRTLRNADNSLIVDIGYANTQVIIFQGGIPVMTRIIPIGGLRFTEEIMQAFELEFEEADRLKERQAGLLRRLDWEGEKTALNIQLELLVTELAREISRTYEYYRIQNKGATIDKVYLIGGGAKLDNLVQHLSAQFEISVVRPDILATIAIHESLDPQYLHNMSAQLTVAVGLALRGGKP